MIPERSAGAEADDGGALAAAALGVLFATNMHGGDQAAVASAIKPVFGICAAVMALAAVVALVVPLRADDDPRALVVPLRAPDVPGALAVPLRAHDVPGARSRVRPGARPAACPRVPARPAGAHQTYDPLRSALE